MHKKTANRWRTIITLLVVTFLAFGSFWLLQMVQRGGMEVDGDAFKDEPDYIIEKFSFVRMSPEGQPRYLFSGAKLTHRPIDDSSDVELPVLKSLAPGRPPLTVQSQRARILHAENQVDLSGKVEIRRPESPASQAMRIRTEALTVFPDEDRMSSNVEVDMMLGSSTIVGTGMQANNATRQLHLASKGRMVLPPKEAR